MLKVNCLSLPSTSRPTVLSIYLSSDTAYAFTSIFGRQLSSRFVCLKVERSDANPVIPHQIKNMLWVCCVRFPPVIINSLCRSKMARHPLNCATAQVGYQRINMRRQTQRVHNALCGFSLLMTMYIPCFHPHSIQDWARWNSIANADRSYCLKSKVPFHVDTLKYNISLCSNNTQVCESFKQWTKVFITV